MHTETKEESTESELRRKKNIFFSFIQHQDVPDSFHCRLIQCKFTFNRNFKYYYQYCRFIDVLLKKDKNRIKAKTNSCKEINLETNNL